MENYPLDRNILEPTVPLSREIFKKRNKKYDKDEDEIILYMF